MDGRSAATRSVVFGGIMFLVGLVLVVSSRSAAAAAEGNNGMRTAVAIGAMIFGALRVGYGVVKLRRSKPS